MGPENTVLIKSMNDEEVDSLEKKERFARIRRVKKLMRYLPRKATLHNYPFIRFFANTARKRHYLWSFRSTEVIPALYAGWILTMLPLIGVQVPIAFALALIFRANLVILVALQFVSNTLTLVPIYTADYYIGHYILSFFGGESAPTPEEIKEINIFASEVGFMEACKNLDFTQMVDIGKKFISAFRDMMLGGAIIGYFLGLISSILYKLLIKKMTYNKISKIKSSKLN